MKNKILFSITAILAVSSLLTKCNKKENGAPSNASEAKIIQAGTLSKGRNTELSSFSKSLGIQEIAATAGDSGKVNLKLFGRTVIVNGYRLKIDGEAIEVKTVIPGEEFVIVDKKKSSSFTINIKQRKGNFVINKRKFSLENISNVRLRTSEKFESLKLFIIAIELFDKEQIRKSSVEWARFEAAADRYDQNNKLLAKTSAGKSCYRYNINFGATRSATEHSASIDEAAFLAAYPKCQKVGITDITCFMSISPCVGTVTFTCTGSICDEEIVTE